MARDICLTNTTPLLASLDRYIATLQSFRDQIVEQNPTLEDTFASAKEARDGWLVGQSGM